jgi:hypothetical protein
MNQRYLICNGQREIILMMISHISKIVASVILRRKIKFNITELGIEFRT